VKERAEGLQKVTLTGATVKLPPRATTRMAVGAQVTEPQPTAIVTARMGAKVLRGVDGTWASVGRRHRLGPLRRWCVRMDSVAFARGTMGSLREPLEGFGVIGAFAFELGR